MYIKILLQATGAYCLLYIRRRLILMASKKLDRFEINGVTKEELTLTSYWCVKIIPEVSWVRPLLEGMVGFSSPFESFRTILWY